MSQTLIEKQAGSGAVPKGLLAGAAALIGFAILASWTARLTDVGTVRMPAATAVETLSLRFEDQANGAVLVRDVRRDEVIHTVAPGTNGFIRATLRGFARERKLSGLGDRTPFILARWSDGALSLDDELTGRRVSLDAFGPTNAQAFATILLAGRRTP